MTSRTNLGLALMIAVVMGFGAASYAMPIGVTTILQAVAAAVRPPSMSEVMTAAMNGMNTVSTTKNENDEALSTTPLEALDSDPATSLRTINIQQNIVIHNLDGTNHICLGLTTWADACGAGDMTCMSGAATDGWLIKAGTSRSIRIDGSVRPCIQGTAAVSSYQVERSVVKGR